MQLTNQFGVPIIELFVQLQNLKQASNRLYDTVRCNFIKHIEKSIKRPLTQNEYVRLTKLLRGFFDPANTMLEKQKNITDIVEMNFINFYQLRAAQLN